MLVFREATPSDIPQMQVVRNSVKENILSNPAMITETDYLEFICHRGRGWVCETDNNLVGFAIADMQDNNIWALFVHPDFEGKGIGKSLQTLMLDWYFGQGKKHVWLGTLPATRADGFYRSSGWTEIGTNGPDEIRFEMSKDQYGAITNRM